MLFDEDCDILGSMSILEELEGDAEAQAMIDSDLDEEEDAEESLMGEPDGVSDSDAIDIVAGLNDPSDPDYIDIYAI